MSRSYKKGKVTFCCICDRPSFYILPGFPMPCRCARPLRGLFSKPAWSDTVPHLVYDSWKTMTSSNTGGGKHNQRKFWQRYSNKQFRIKGKIISKNTVQNFNSGHFNDSFKPYPIFKRNINWKIC